MNSPIPHHELSRIYHCRLADLVAAILALEAAPARYTVAEYNAIWRGLTAQRARLVAEWKKQEGKKGE